MHQDPHREREADDGRAAVDAVEDPAGHLPRGSEERHVELVDLRHRHVDEARLDGEKFINALHSLHQRPVSSHPPSSTPAAGREGIEDEVLHVLSRPLYGLPPLKSEGQSGSYPT